MEFTQEERDNFDNKIFWEKQGAILIGYTEYAKSEISHYIRWEELKELVGLKLEYNLHFKYVSRIYPDGKMIDRDMFPSLEQPPVVRISFRHSPHNVPGRGMSVKIDIHPTGLAYEWLFTTEDIFGRYARRTSYAIPDMIEVEILRFVESITTSAIQSGYEAYVAALSGPKVYPVGAVIGKLAFWRKKNKYSLRQVQELTGISNAYLSQLETGKIAKPSFDYISRLLKLYQIKVNF